MTPRAVPPPPDGGFHWSKNHPWSIIDFHTHAFPDDLAGAALEKLSASAGIKPCIDGTVSGLLRSMDRVGIDTAVVHTIATAPKQVESIRRFCLEARSPRIIPFPSVFPGSETVQDELGRIAGDGFPGIKLHPEYQRFHIDDEKLEPVWAACRSLGLTVFLHAGEDISFPASDRASPIRIRRILDSFPGLTVAAAHTGGWRRWDEVGRHLLGRDVYLETSFSLKFMPPERLREMLLLHRSDRLLFGSDSPWDDQGEALAGILGLGLPQPLLERMLFLNGQELLRRTPSAP